MCFCRKQITSATGPAPIMHIHIHHIIYIHTGSYHRIRTHIGTGFICECVYPRTPSLCMRVFDVYSVCVCVREYTISFFYLILFHRLFYTDAVALLYSHLHIIHVRLNIVNVSVCVCECVCSCIKSSYLRPRSSRRRSVDSGKCGQGPVDHLVLFFQAFDSLQVDETVVLQRLTSAHYLFYARRKRANPSATCLQT